MAETVKSVAQLHDEAGPTDSTEFYERLWAVLGELTAKVQARFELTRDPSTEVLESYGGGPGTPRGLIRGYVGPEIDWMIHSWMGNPEQGFSNMHLSVWLGPHIKVPHLGIAFGTLPAAWVYVDYVPRSDLMIDLESLDTYFGEVNEEHLEERSKPGTSPFVSRSLYVREALSETAHCYMLEDTAAAIPRIAEIASRHVDRWLRWVDEATPVPADERAALADRDLQVRRNVAVLDPANVMGERFFGKETTDLLVGALWGEHRQLPRPSA